MSNPGKIIGTLGGMGSSATADFNQKFIRASPAKADLNHRKVLIPSHPQIPDRMAAMQGEGSDPPPGLVEYAQVLIREATEHLEGGLPL